MIDIEEFYKFNQIDDQFDEITYAKSYPDTKDFYQPYCKENNINDRERLYYHCIHYNKQYLQSNRSIIKHDNVYEIISDWPKAICTEQHYLSNHINNQKGDHETTYIGCSWANILDANKTPTLDIINEIKNINARKVTVCQHIRWRELLNIWEQMQLDTVYASHCTNICDIYHPNIKPWPLYASSIGDMKFRYQTKKKYLASFVGCHRKDYRSPIRILLNNYFLRKCDKRIYFELKDDWFYEKNIFSNAHITKDQIAKINLYNKIIADSTFSLCPEGTGPNTIRIWESMALGSIPVIYSDDWYPPQLQSLQWDEFSIFIKQDDYDKTLEILDSISEKQIEIMKANCIKAYDKFNNMTCW